MRKWRLLTSEKLPFVQVDARRYIHVEMVTLTLVPKVNCKYTQHRSICLPASANIEVYSRIYNRDI